ncbi:2-trimethylaminoethylphosphonate dioxygenase [Novosphingobium sp.]|uniref:2-trimethylaminoethylphosphonate dioxygenase n=1 Tax=Novosphingobium sp. TaxID=1874826 RepID=UPI003B522617
MTKDCRVATTIDRSCPRILDQGAALRIEIDGEARRFHAIWLRDNAMDAQTRSTTNGQRLITLLDIPADITIASAEWAGDRLRVCFAPEGKVVDFAADWLAAHAYDTPQTRASGWTKPGITRWDASATVCSARYGDICGNDAERLRWLTAIREYGVARLTGVPTTDGVPAEIAAQFGYVRETNYGRIFDVRVEVNPSNLAYTNLGLQAHTDNPYRDPAPGLQILACLHNDVEGGDSIVVDGFAIAARLQAEWPEGFALLTQTPARFAYTGAQGVRLHAKKPLIELGPDGELLAVRFNNRSAAPFTDIAYDRMAGYYRAYRRMAELVDDPALAMRFRLAPGTAFVVDNLRVLHARTAITSQGNRHLQGCYADRDGLLSTLAALEESTRP